MRKYLTIWALLSCLMVVGCNSKGDRAGNSIDRDSELQHYFSGVDEIGTSSAMALNSSDEECMNITIDPDNLMAIDAFHHFELVKAIKLETKRNVLIGGVDKIIYSDSTIFILDRDMGKSVYAFDSNGKYIATIGYAGRGPEEYIEPTDIYYDSQAKHIVVWDQFSHKFLAYGKDGKFIYSRAVPLRFLRCELLQHDTTLWCSNMTVNSGVSTINGYNLLSLDSICANVKGMFDHNPLVMNYIPSGTNMRCVGNSIFYHPQFSDTIYELNDERVTARFNLNFNGLTTLPDNLMELCGGDYEKFMSQFHGTNVSYFENDFLVTDSALYFEVNLGNDVVPMRYSYSANDVQVLLSNIYQIDKFNPEICQACNLPWGDMTKSTYADGIIYAAVNYSLIKLLPTEELNYLNLQDMDDDANPVIVVMKER